MHDLLQKIGLPATVAAAIAAIITAAPLLFQVDKRYAKEDDLKAQITKLETANTELRHEVAQLVGFQQAMVALIQQGKMPKVVGAIGSETYFGADLQLAQAAPVTRPPLVRQVKPAASAPAAPASAASAPEKADKPERKLEKPLNWRELAEGLQRQQMRLMKE